MNYVFYKIWKIIKMYLHILFINVLRSFKHVDWTRRLIIILLIFLYLLGVLAFDKKGPYVPSFQKNKLIKNDIRMEREDSKK
jgi:hypothetical protein